MVQVDRLFREIGPNDGDFSFDERVAEVFDDMISRSVPLYADVQRSIPALVDLLDHEAIRVVDLGCSTGTSLIHLAQTLSHRNLELVGVDNSAAMLVKCQEKTCKFGLSRVIETHHCDIQSFEFEHASVVLMNYTLQFVEPRKRLKLLTKIRKSMRPNGLLLISEKVIHDRPAVDDALVELYFEFKRRQGYSDLEISRKRDALETVLVPLTMGQNKDLLVEAGFGRIELMLKWFNFATFIAYPQESPIQ